MSLHVALCIMNPITCLNPKIVHAAMWRIWDKLRNIVSMCVHFCGTRFVMY